MCSICLKVECFLRKGRNASYNHFKRIRAIHRKVKEKGEASRSRSVIIELNQSRSTVSEKTEKKNTCEIKKNRLVYIAFMDRWKTFDRVNREALDGVYYSQ